MNAGSVPGNCGDGDGGLGGGGEGGDGGGDAFFTQVSNLVSLWQSLRLISFLRQQFPTQFSTLLPSLQASFSSITVTPVHASLLSHLAKHAFTLMLPIG
jgi:hypothetical protein